MHEPVGDYTWIESVNPELLEVSYDCLLELWLIKITHLIAFSSYFIQPKRNCQLSANHNGVIFSAVNTSY